MADRPVRVYLVINPGPLFGARRVTFPSSAPAGSVVRVDGRLIRVLLTDTAGADKASVLVMRHIGTHGGLRRVDRVDGRRGE
ncbi:hypothetical protein [Streptomyces hirsutus]|uniref:hypothetical protein n=1 Tax=Streptomyces hirsutus TaxID=35620 RepID=UPI000B0657D7|nr:hypothetical protein [Streptomyces hirsutus]